MTWLDLDAVHALPEPIVQEPSAVLIWVALHVFVIGAALLGAIFASFGCVVGERLRRKESINGRSHCICGRQLGVLENIPVLSWTLLRGRSRCCRSKIPARYVAWELGLAAGFALASLAGVVLGPILMVAMFAALVWGNFRAAGADRTGQPAAATPVAD